MAWNYQHATDKSPRQLVYDLAQEQGRRISRQSGVREVAHLGFVGGTLVYELEVRLTPRAAQKWGVTSYEVSVSI